MVFEGLAIIFAVLFVAMGIAFVVVNERRSRAEAERGKYRKDYSRILADYKGEMDRHDSLKREYPIACEQVNSLREEAERWQRSWRAEYEVAKATYAFADTAQSQIDALLELWRHSAARAFDLDEDNYYMRDNLGVLSDDIAFAKRDLAGTRETLLSVGNISEERQQRIQAYEQQQRVSDGNIQRLEAERDEAVQLKEFWLQSAFLAETKIADANAALQTQRRHNDTLNTVQARLMRESDEMFGAFVAERGLREGWEQTAGELEWEVQRLQTALVVGDNTITRMRAERRSRCPDCGKYVRRDKK